MKIVPLCLALLSVGAAATASAEIVLYENDNYSGRNFRASGTVSNLEEVGFNDRASSAVVRRGRWQLCGDAYFRGNCVTLESALVSAARAAANTRLV